MHTLGTDPEFMWSITDSRPGRYTGMLPAKFVLDRLEHMGEYDILERYDGKKVLQTAWGQAFADGASWELNPFPSDTPRYLVDNMAGLFRTSREIQKALTTDTKELSLIVQPSVPLDVEMLATWGDPSLAEFGCDPDKSIHPRIVDPSCVNAAKHPWRYNGAHIHFGLDDISLPNKDFFEEFFSEEGENVYEFVLLCDALLGTLGIVYDEIVYGYAAQRRTVYGQPGVYRIQPHGIEYRALSNSWLLSKDRAFGMLGIASFISDYFLNGTITNFLDDIVNDIRIVMIGGDSGAAKELLLKIVDYTEDDKLIDVATDALDVAMYPLQHWTKEWFYD